MIITTSAVRIAELASRAHGYRAVTHDIATAVVSPSGQARVAAAYRALPEYDAGALPAFRAMREETMRQLDTLLALGFTVETSPVDPYACAADMFADVARRRIVVLSTAVTGGHPVFSDADNDAFRAVHDVYGHAASGRGFDRHGEEAAYRRHAAMFSPLARLAMATETRGQNAAMITAAGAFDVQRVAILPAWARELHTLTPLPAELAPATLQARAMHAAGGLK